MRENHRTLTIRLLFFILLFLVAFPFLGAVEVNAIQLAQQPTLDRPTVTSTPIGSIVTVRSDLEQYINVRSGPGIFYEKVGVILAEQQLPAKGRSAGGDWILIEYLGVPGSVAWVYAPFVNLTPGSLPIIEPPPTPTPLYTTTIDPTLAAQFVVTSVPTRLPTFTELPPLIIPTYEDRSVGMGFGNVPIGLIILSLAAVGILFGLFSLVQGR